MAESIEFFFDVISPYVYIADHRLRALAAGRADLTVVYRPVLFAAILGHWGQLGPAEIPAKRDFTFRDVIRRCHEHGLALRGTATHPFNPLLALRALTAVPDAERPAAAAAVLRAGWGDGGELSDPAVLTAALTAVDLPGAELVRRAQDPDIKAALTRETERAISLGVFGVPTFHVRGEVLWGQDRIVDIDPILAGRDPVTPERIAPILSHPSSAQRPGAKR